MSQRLSPALDELLGDSLIQAVMRADNVEPQALRTLLAETAGRIASGRSKRAGKTTDVLFARAPADRRAPYRGARGSARVRPSPFADSCGSALCC